MEQTAQKAGLESCALSSANQNRVICHFKTREMFYLSGKRGVQGGKHVAILAKR